MESFCPKCGSALPANEQFCKSCGAAAAAPAAAQVKSGSSAVKIILIIVAVIVVLFMLVVGVIAYIGYRVSRSIHINSADGQMTLQTPEGKVNLNSSETFTAAELGTDPYPGAQSTRGGMKMDLPTGSMVTGVYLTSDSKQQVIDFYKAKFGSGAMFMESSDAAVVSMNKSQQEAVVVTITANSSRDSGKTRITITHTKNTKTP
jgi:hypothetical protein